MTVLLIVFFVVEGVVEGHLRPQHQAVRRLGVGCSLSGIIGILLGAYLWANMPVASEWVLGVLLGIQLVAEGAALAYLAWMVRSS